MLIINKTWKFTLATLLFALAVWSPRFAHAAPLAQDIANTGDTVRVMVKVDAAVMAQRIQTASMPSVSANSLAKVSWEVIEVDAAHAAATINELRATAGVLEVTPDYPLELAWSPDDPSFVLGEQWSLEKIGADVAWEFATGEAITVAVIDSGIDLSHPDLQGRLVPGYNFIDDNDNVSDGCGHGTHVAGIIAAAANNGLGVAGVAHQAMIMPIKVIGDNCLGSYARLMEGIIWAVDQGVRVISITSGGGYEHTGLQEALAYAKSHGVLVAVAAGNRGNDEPFYPGSFEDSFTVAGTDVNDRQYGMSNYGEQIDISAPATNILNTYWNADEGSTYAHMTGTSMAAPHVAAVAALILSIDPKLSLDDLETTLKTTATDLGSEGWDPIFGAGRLTAWRAVAAVSPATGNVRLGHYRVPEMDVLQLDNIAVNASDAGITLSWTQEAVTADRSIVIYRAPVPVFEGAEDIAELAAAAQVNYVDTSVATDQDYYYWLVEAKHDVEIAMTDSYTMKLATAPVAPQTPTVPEEPVTPEAPATPAEPQQPATPEQPHEPAQPSVAMFMPYLER